MTENITDFQPLTFSFLQNVGIETDNAVGEPDVELISFEDMASCALRLLIHKQSNGHSLKCHSAIWHISECPQLGWDITDTVESFKGKLIKNGITRTHGNYCFIKPDGAKNDQNDLTKIIHSKMYEHHRLYYVVLQY